MKHLAKYIGCLFVLLFLAACQAVQIPPPEQNPLATPLSIDLSLPTPEPVSASAPASANEQPKWHYDTTFKGFVIDEPQDGHIDVHMDDELIDGIYGPIILQVRAGAPTKFTTTVPGEITICTGTIKVNGNSVWEGSNCEGKLVPVEVGETVVMSSTGPIGGYRWSPQNGFGWKSGNPDSCPPLDGLCWKQVENRYEWFGAQDGMADVHQAAHEGALSFIRAGGVVTLTMSVPTQVVGTCVVTAINNGKEIEARNDCSKIDQPILLEPGEVVLIGGGGDIGGWRLSPQDNFGWRKDK